MYRTIFAGLLIFLMAAVYGQEIDLYSPNGRVPYVKVNLPGVPVLVDMMLDTGAHSMILPEEALKTVVGLKYEKDGQAVLADGTTRLYRVYTIAKLTVGTCELRNVEVAIIPNAPPILGMAAIMKLAPITLDLESRKVKYECGG